MEAVGDALEPEELAGAEAVDVAARDAVALARQVVLEDASAAAGIEDAHARLEVAVDDRPGILHVLARLDLGPAVAAVAHPAMLAERMRPDPHHGVHLVDHLLAARIAPELFDRDDRADAHTPN